MDSDWIQAIHNRRMLRFNAEQLWHNLIRQGWKRVQPQWGNSETLQSWTPEGRCAAGMKPWLL